MQLYVKWVNNLMLDRTPQVFISYSWTTEEFKSKVKELAERLVHDGVDVKLDIWDLKDGHDKYAFMEECVTNPNIDRVLIICDKGYATKADKRQGGVGNETAIISAEVYQNATQEKFIPVIMERDEHGEPYMPAYLKSRMYKDLTGDNYSKGYEELLRNIYEKPSERKPMLGKRPMWLDEDESAELYPVKEAKKKVEALGPEQLRLVAAQDFIDVYLNALKKFYKRNIDTAEYLNYFRETKDYRDVFLDYIKSISTTIEHLGEFMADTFEKMYNTLYNVETFEPNACSCGCDDFDLFRVHVWELFVCTTTYFLHNEAYKSLNELLVHTYFLRTSPLGSETKPLSYERFRFHSKMIEEQIKPTLEAGLKNKFTLTGHYLCMEREYLPVYTGKKIAEADLFLYQIYDGLDLQGLTKTYAWFPTCYIYAEQYTSMWQRLKSKRYCEKIEPLFGVSTIGELIERLNKCKMDWNIRYSGGFADPAPVIMSYIKVDEIATLP